MILNNQIALYKSTGQPFTLISFALNPIAEKQKILTINQLQNAVRLSTDKKDKICVIKNKILILMSKADEKTLSILVTKLKTNLPNNDPSYIDMVMQNISGYPFQVNDKIENAEGIFAEIFEDELHQ